MLDLVKHDQLYFSYSTGREIIGKNLGDCLVSQMCRNETKKGFNLLKRFATLGGPTWT